MTPSVDLASHAILAAIIVTFGYISMCVVWPFGAHRRCHGTGKLRGPMGGIRICRRCHGTGLRIRIGRHLWNHLRRLHRGVR